MSPINQHLASRGIGYLDAIYSVDEIERINHMVTPLFNARADRPRSYIYSDEIGSLGLLPLILSPRMRDCLFAIMPDAVLYHMQLYEITGNQDQPHIFSDVMRGWHRDPDSENGGRNTTHASVFIYLTDVATENGPFEFIPQYPFSLLHARTPYVSMVGSAGTAFVWNRSFYHRAAPNRSNVRRRLLKISIQNNRFPSENLANEHFSKLIAATPEGEPALDTLLGRYQEKSAPLQFPVSPPAFHEVKPQQQLGLSNRYLLTWQARLISRAIKRRLGITKVPAVAYD